MKRQRDQLVHGRARVHDTTEMVARRQGVARDALGHQWPAWALARRASSSRTVAISCPSSQGLAAAIGGTVLTSETAVASDAHAVMRTIGRWGSSFRRA